MRPKPRPIVVRPANAGFNSELIFSLRERAVRDAQSLFIAEGARFLVQALEQGASFAGLAICPYRLNGSYLREMVTLVERAGAPLIKLSPAEYQAISPGASNAGENIAASQGTLLVLQQCWEPLSSTVGNDELWIGVESVRTPGNLGTLLRSGDAAGATGMIVFDRSSDGSPQGVDPYDPAAVRATMGSLFSHRFIRTTHRAFRKWPLRNRFLTLGGTPDAELDYRSPDYGRPVVLMLGDERTGLTDGQRNSCDRLVRIPMLGAPDSLNLAMAGTLMLYEVYNQRHPAARAG